MTANNAPRPAAILDNDKKLQAGNADFAWNDAYFASGKPASWTGNASVVEVVVEVVVVVVVDVDVDVVDDGDDDDDDEEEDNTFFRYLSLWLDIMDNVERM
ncbi:hypothetical protein DPMN_152738 [Dreissena polymorpha]|uniref:Uncharacterized protein n=1 Tax=Dreissena polymorpha TaxID=45954 RepID=A0A9D4FHC4_DREPO|nr:hypothetical protein DPMN_152738 [Dreissena polymorpha]